MISGLCFLCLERSSMGWLPGKRPWWGGGGWGRLWGLFWWVLPWLLLVWLYRLNSGLLDCCCRFALLWWWCELAALAIILFRLLTNLLVVVTRPLEAEFRSICRRAVRLSLSFFTSDIFSPNLKIIHVETCHFRNILVFVNLVFISLCIVYLVYASSEAWTWTLSWMGPRDSSDLQQKGDKVHFMPSSFFNRFFSATQRIPYSQFG